MLITTTSITPSRNTSNTRAGALADAIRHHLGSTPTDPSSNVMLGACDDEYNVAGGVFRECSFTVAELLAALDEAGDDGVVVRFDGGTNDHRSSTEIEIPDCFDIVQLSFWADLNAMLPAGVPADEVRS